jgi:hypothetical protein
MNLHPFSKENPAGYIEPLLDSGQGCDQNVNAGLLSSSLTFLILRSELVLL